MKKRIAFMILVLIFFSCAHRDLQLPESNPSASNASHVNIIRESRFLGLGLSIDVMFDDAIICSLRAGEYVTFEVESGFHSLGLSESTITVPFEKERKYYFLIKTSPGQFGFEIERIDDRRGAYLVSTLKALE
jgi:hypothetical protein